MPRLCSTQEGGVGVALLQLFGCIYCTIAHLLFFFKRLLSPLRNISISSLADCPPSVPILGCFRLRLCLPFRLQFTPAGSSPCLHSLSPPPLVLRDSSQAPFLPLFIPSCFLIVWPTHFQALLFTEHGPHSLLIRRQWPQVLIPYLL